MRRLRENTMLEAEINAAGTVTVEGHHVGELQGFRFTADQSAGGEDGKAIRAAAQKALATEFETRAERFSGGPNGDIAIASDGTIRWIGAPIATLTDGEDILKPRIVLLADEQLTGASRDKVAARAERFLNFQIESLLKPLLDLKSAEQLSGIARGIAFRLVENLGVLNRREIADEMKTLDQDGRAALRRLGVRFGAYHIFVPSLLKPAPAGLVTLLWSLKNDGKGKPGFGDVVHALSTGRTSLAVDADFEPAFYRLAGYRVLGKRAVRVDILERLADLIRPALAWKAGTGQRPDGAFDGNAFMVTPPMMSILGATADDMEQILKGLGYRGDARPADEVTAKLETLDAAAKEAAEPQPSIEPEAVAAPEPDSVGEVAEQAPESIQVNSETEAQQVEPISETPAIDTTEPTAEAPTQEPEAVSAAEPAEAPKPIILWRPQRFEQRPRQHGANQRQDNQNRNRQGQQQRRHSGPDQQAGERKDRPFKGKPHRNDHGGKSQDAKKPQPHHQQKPREERPVRIDPDSPFAKLAALRDQLRK